MERAAQETADFRAAMMELKHVAAPNGRRPAWPRRHRTTAKPTQRQRHTLPAASRRGPRAPAFQALIEGWVRPKEGAGNRAPLLQAVQLRARAVHPRTRLGRRGIRLFSEWVWKSLAFPFFRPILSEGSDRLPHHGQLKASRSLRKVPVPLVGGRRHTVIT